MGQRHQAFVIARLVPHGQTPPFYRCIAALHHQWCYGRQPLLAARRFLTLVKQKDNAEIIHEEIRLLQGKYGRWGQKPKIPGVPSPYIAFLLASAWNVDFDKHGHGEYVTGGSLKDCLFVAEMGSCEGDNNDGITVIDITHPEKPAYCFVSAGGMEAKVERIPLTATDYARAYYPIPDAEEMKDARVRRIEEDVLTVIGFLDGESLVTLSMLAEAWPAEYEENLQNSNAKVDTTPYDEGVASAAIPSLAQLSLGPALDHAIDNDDTEQLEELVWLPGKAGDILAHLQTRHSLPDSILPLLAKSLGQRLIKRVIDLSHFALSTDQIVTLLAQFEGVEVLKISHNPFVAADTIRAVLTAVPRLKRLVSLGTSIPDKDLVDLLRVNEDLLYHLDALVLPNFWHLTHDGYPNAFSFFKLGPGNHSNAIASIPYFTPALVVQALTDYLSPFLSGNSYLLSAINNSSLTPQVMFSTEIRGEGVKWSERSVPVPARYTKGGCRGEGWIFGFRWSTEIWEGPNKQYGFIRVNPPVGKAERGQANQNAEASTLSHKICDFKGFLVEMEREGRPAPPAAAVGGLEDALSKLTKKGLTLMTQKDAEWFAMQGRKKTY